MAMDEVHQAMRQVSGKIRAVIGRAVFFQTAGDVYPRVALSRQLDVRVRLVVPQQDVIARLPLLDEVVLERQSLFFVVDPDKVDVRASWIKVPVFTSAR